MVDRDDLLRFCCKNYPNVRVMWHIMKAPVEYIHLYASFLNGEIKTNAHLNTFMSIARDRAVLRNYKQFSPSNIRPMDYNVKSMYVHLCRSALSVFLEQLQRLMPRGVRAATLVEYCSRIDCKELCLLALCASISSDLPHEFLRNKVFKKTQSDLIRAGRHSPIMPSSFPMDGPAFNVTIDFARYIQPFVATTYLRSDAEMLPLSMTTFAIDGKMLLKANQRKINAWKIANQLKELFLDNVAREEIVEKDCVIFFSHPWMETLIMDEFAEEAMQKQYLKILVFQYLVRSHTKIVVNDDRLFCPWSVFDEEYDDEPHRKNLIKELNASKYGEEIIDEFWSKLSDANVLVRDTLRKRMEKITDSWQSHSCT